MNDLNALRQAILELVNIQREVLHEIVMQTKYDNKLARKQHEQLDELEEKITGENAEEPNVNP